MAQTYSMDSMQQKNMQMNSYFCIKLHLVVRYVQVFKFYSINSTLNRLNLTFQILLSTEALPTIQLGRAEADSIKDYGGAVCSSYLAEVHSIEKWRPDV